MALSAVMKIVRISIVCAIVVLVPGPGVPVMVVVMTVVMWNSLD